MTSPSSERDTPKISYAPTTWKDSAVGGTAITSARLNNMETGLAQTTATIDDHDDRLDALEAAAIAFAAGQGTVITHGPTASRPAPTLGTYFYDETLRKPIWGDGTVWRDAAGTTLTGTGGAAGPATFTAVVQSDNSILCTWSAVGGATTYTLASTASPTGIAGKTALTGTSTTFAPGVLGTYELFVFATVSGVQTAASPHATAVLTGSTGTPAQILNIGSGSTQNHFNVGIGYATGHIDKTMAQITGGFIDSPYFTPNAVGNAVQFSVFANGGTTSSTTSHPRSELRELLADGTTKAAWTCGSGKTHVMSGTSTVTHLPADSEASGTPKPQVCFAQIHDADGDVVRLQVENSGSTPSDPPGGNSVNNLHIVGHTHSPNGKASTEVKTSLQSSYTVGTAIDWKIEVIDTTCNLYIGGVKKFTFTISGTGFYFKAGDYQQFSTAVTNAQGNPDGGYQSTSNAKVELKNLVVTHTPAL